MAKKRPKGLKYRITKINSGWIKKGNTPWNKGTNGICKPNSGSFIKGEHRSKDTEFKKGQLFGENHHNWKGSDVGYFALHTWVYRNLGKATKCNKCGSEKNVQWANKSRKYLRNINDWLQLCIKCHNEYDKGFWGAIKNKWHA